MNLVEDLNAMSFETRQIGKIWRKPLARHLARPLTAVYLLAAAVSVAIAQKPTLVVDRCTLFDSESGKMVRNRTVTVSGDWIVRVEQAGKVKKIPSNAVRIDGRGKFLIPGLNDAH